MRTVTMVARKMPDRFLLVLEWPLSKREREGYLSLAGSRRPVSREALVDFGLGGKAQSGPSNIIGANPVRGAFGHSLKQRCGRLVSGADTRGVPTVLAR